MPVGGIHAIVEKPLSNTDVPGLTAQERQERALLRLVVARDRRAFEALYRLYFPRLVRFIRQVTRRPDLVDEVLDDVMLVVWRRADSFTETSRVSTWVFGIAYRQSLKHLQRDSRRARVPDPVEDDDTFERVGPEALAMQRQSLVRLRAALETLPVEQRAVVELTYFHGCGYREIAEALGCPVDTVKTRMFHARRKLRLALDDEL